MKCKYCHNQNMETTMGEFTCRINNRTLSIDNIRYFECTICENRETDPFFLLNLNQVVEKLIPYFELIDKKI